MWKTARENEGENWYSMKPQVLMIVLASEPKLEPAMQA